MTLDFTKLLARTDREELAYLAAWLATPERDRDRLEEWVDEPGAVLLDEMTRQQQLELARHALAAEISRLDG